MKTVTRQPSSQWIRKKAGVKRKLLDTVKARKLAYYGHTMKKTRELPGKRDNVNVQCQVHEGDEGHARPGWTTSRRGQDSPWKSQSE